MYSLKLLLASRILLAWAGLSSLCTPTNQPGGTSRKRITQNLVAELSWHNILLACIDIGSLVAVGTKKHRDFSVLSVDEKVSGILKGSVELLLALSLAAGVGPAETKISSQHFVVLRLRSLIRLCNLFMSGKLSVVPSDG